MHREQTAEKFRRWFKVTQLVLLSLETAWVQSNVFPTTCLPGLLGEAGLSLGLWAPRSRDDKDHP